jgi:hypothetical protein
MDTELAVGWVGTPARDLRIKLWSELLGTSEVVKWPPNEFISKWNAIAGSNAAIPVSKLPKGRQGFVVPHDPTKFLGRENRRIPEVFTQLLDPKVSPEVDEAFA